MTVLPDIALAQRESKFQIRTDKQPGQVCFGPGALMTIVNDNGREEVVESRAERYARIRREEGESDIWHPAERETWNGAWLAGLALVVGVFWLVVGWAVLG